MMWNNPTSSGRLVSVIPRCDAESSNYRWISICFFVLDSASQRRMTDTNRLFEIQNEISFFISRKINLIPPLTSLTPYIK